MERKNSIHDLAAVRDHRRQWRRCLYVYPVISRRSGGLSVGVNLNPDKGCTFSCVYCQINRRVRRGLTEVDLEILADELHLALSEAVSGRLWSEPRFAETPPALRRLNDIALSGDGEPTCLANFDRAVAVADAQRRALGLENVRIVVITNASHLRGEPFRRALGILDADHGEIWAKLDAGTEEYFRRVNRPAAGLTLGKIVRDIAEVAAGRPVVIQSLFARLDGEEPPAEEIDAYCGRVREILDAGGRIRLIQVHTVARPPAEAFVARLPDDRLDAVADRIRRRVPDVPVEVYYGADVPPQQP